MSACPFCTANPNNDAGLCGHHAPHESDWATENRVFCDFVHRGIEPKRLPASEREPMADTWWEGAA